MRLRLATRASALALTQSKAVQAAFEAAHPGLRVELVPVESQGDQDRASPLRQIGGAGVFTAAVDRALLEGRAEVAVHSLKDLPTTVTPGLHIEAVPERADDRDVLVAETPLTDLPRGATVGTGSLRRRAQLLRARPDLVVADLRGNIDTRLVRWREAGWAGLVLAAAGLDRLALTVPRQDLGPDFLPAPGQGALAVVCRTDDGLSRSLVTAIDHGPSHQRVTAERTFLQQVEAGCHAPVGARTRFLENGDLRLEAAVFATDGRRVIQHALEGPAESAAALGTAVAQAIRAGGGQSLLHEAFSS